MKRYALDTNTVFHFLKGNKKIREKITIEKNEDSIDAAITIYIQFKNMKPSKTVDDADLLIGAYCIQNDYILVTNNLKHFEDIEGLKIENWLDWNAP